MSNGVVPDRIKADCDLRHGDQVDVYVTPSEKTAQRAAKGAPDALAPRLVLAGIPVRAVRAGGGLSTGAQDQPVVLTVAPAQVLTLVQAMAQGQIDLVRVPLKEQKTPAPATSSAGPTP